MRAFIAASLTDEIGKALSDLIQKLAQRFYSIRWIPIENIHLTIKFLGEVEAASLKGIIDRVQVACQHQTTIHLMLSELGVFKNLQEPRILWLGPARLPEENRAVIALKGLFHQVEDPLGELGFEKERRGFTPHLTLSRLKKPDPGELRRLFDQYKTVVLPEWTINALHLYKSDLFPEGAVYTRLNTFNLIPEK